MAKDLSRYAQAFSKHQSSCTRVQVRLDLDSLSQKNPWQCLGPLVSMLISHVYQ